MKTVVLILFTLVSLPAFAQGSWDTPSDLRVDIRGESARKTDEILKTDAGTVIRSIVSCSSPTLCRLFVAKNVGGSGPQEDTFGGVFAFYIHTIGRIHQVDMSDSLLRALTQSANAGQYGLENDLLMFRKDLDQKNWSIHNAAITCTSIHQNNWDESHWYTFPTISLRDVTWVGGI